MSNSRLLFGWWSGVANFALWGTGLVVFARWLPPLDPSLDAFAVATLLQTRNVPILIGVAIMTVTAVLYLPWTVLLSEFIKKRENDNYILSQTQIIAGVMSQMTWFLPPFLWGAAAYRPFRDPEITQALLDIGWLIFITGIGPFILQYSALAIAIFTDKSKTPIFPRWVGYLQVWVSISFLPAILPFFMKTGPFAWDGFFVWWVPLALVLAWYGVMLTLTRQAIIRGDLTTSREV